MAISVVSRRGQRRSTLRWSIAAGTFSGVVAELLLEVLRFPADDVKLLEHDTELFQRASVHLPVSSDSAGWSN